MEKAPKTVEEWPSLPKIETCIKENFFRFSSNTMVRRFFFRHDIDFYTENQDETLHQIEIYRRKETVSDIFLTDWSIRLFADSGHLIKSFFKMPPKKKRIG